MPHGRRWLNLGTAQQTIFLTTTAQGFVPLFKNPDVADSLTAGLLGDFCECRAKLHAFVVMPEHIHLLLTLPPNMSASRLANVIKSKAARRVMKLLDAESLSLLQVSRTLKDRVLWQRSFRSVIIDAQWAFAQKINYIHQNPVRRGIVMKEADYRWSSAMLFELGLAAEDGIRLDEALKLFLTPPQGVAR